MHVTENSGITRSAVHDIWSARQVQEAGYEQMVRSRLWGHAALPPLSLLALANTTVAIDQAERQQELSQRLAAVFGHPDDPMSLVEQRARELIAESSAIVWEGDAQTFQFGFVGKAAEELLGYPSSRWTREPSFWADVVVHPQDRDDAVAYCALCTGKGQDHDFEYRAVAADGRTVWLHDIVRVIKGSKGIATRLRGIMLDITDRRMSSGPA